MAIEKLDRIERSIQKLMLLQNRPFTATGTLSDLCEWIEKEAVLLPDLIHDVRMEISYIEGEVEDGSRTIAV